MRQSTCHGAIADTGAEVSTFPKSVLNENPNIVDRTRDADPDTAVCYGNGQVEYISTIAESGDYDIEVAPEHCSNCLISVDAITASGHDVTFSRHSISITDVDGKYCRTYQRRKHARDWTLPLGILQELTNLRRLHPLSRSTLERLRHPDRTVAAVKPQPARLRMSYLLSARLYEIPRTLRQRVLRLHQRCGHKPADVMTAMVDGQSPLWRNTGVTAAEIQKVFSYEPCLFCVLSKKRKEGADKWMKDHSYKWTKRLHKKQLRYLESQEQIEQQEEADMTGYAPGECISCDNVGPINPKSMEGFTCFFLFRDTHTRRLHVYPSKTADEETYLTHLYDVLRYYHKRGLRTKIIRTDFFSTFISGSAVEYYKDNNLEHQVSTAYKHWQNAVERDVQTVVCNVAAVIHSADLIRADSWAKALEHWVSIWNDTPLSATRTSPNAIVCPGHTVDAKHQYRFAFGDVVSYSLEKSERKWKFDLKNEVGFYFGDHKGMKGGVCIYRPFVHDFVHRGDVHRLPISDIQLLQWYGRRYEARQAGLPFRIARDALISWIPEEPIAVQGEDGEEGEDDPDPPESPENDREHDLPDASNGVEVLDHPDVIRMPVDVLPEDTRPTEPPEEGEARRSGRKRAPPLRLSLAVEIAEPDQLGGDDISAELYHADLHQGSVRSIFSVTEEINRAVDRTRADDRQSGDHLRNILGVYRTLTMFEDAKNEPDAPVDDEENLSTKEALAAHDAPQFREAIKSEVLGNLLAKTKTLRKISDRDLQGRKYVFIDTTLKCKRKKKGNGQPDKHKSRAAARGDQYTRKVLGKGGVLPPSYSPTISPLTFAFILQLATTQRLKCATMDITAAYLQVPIPEDAEWIVTKLEPFVAQICGLDPKQLYKIDKYLYGLPDSGRAFYHHYKSALTKEGYKMSDMDPCLFYRVNREETTYIMLFVDDTYIYSNDQKYIDEVISRMGKYYEVTLDMSAESFLGIQFERAEDGSVVLLQPKLMSKLFKEFPEKRGAKRKPPRHPYGPAPTHSKEQTDDSPAVEPQRYLHLLGLLMYLCHSRPDIMAAVSFCATKSAHPTEQDFENLLHVVEYLRHTKEKGHIIKPGQTEAIQFYCYVDASYLIHPDSKGHTGYCIGINNGGSFYNCSRKQTLVSTSSTHAEMRAVFTLVKDLLYLMYICHELEVPLSLPAIVMEDNSAVITLTGDHSAYVKKCKHFLMILNYVKEQVAFGIVDIQKIKGPLNRADIHTKKVRDANFETHADGILGRTQV